MAAFKQTDELVDELITFYKNKFLALADETCLASRAEGSISWSINVCFVTSFVFSSSG